MLKIHLRKISEFNTLKIEKRCYADKGSMDTFVKHY